MNKTIAFDISSGDKGSAEALAAAVDFSIENKDWKILAYVNEDINLKLPDNLIAIKCPQVIEMTDGPLQVRRKTDSTLVKAIQAVIDGQASAVISAAASGPLVTAGYLMFKTIEGVKPAFAPIFKDIKGKEIIALDIGANIGADAHTLNQYATMGSIYSKVLGFSANPVVKQLNIGEEDKKGTELQTAAFELMKENKDIIFEGNIEANEILTSGTFDVLVTEAYAGNIALKSIEGTLVSLVTILKSSVNNRFLDKIGIGVLAKDFKKNFKSFAKGLAGGACVLGLNELLIKTHGSSDEGEFLHSLETTKKLIEKKLIERIKEAVMVEENNSGSIEENSNDEQQEH